MKTSAIDLFCGIGGLSYGLKKAGISVVAGVDLDKTCRYAYTENVEADFISKDIKKVTGESLTKKYWTGKDHVKILVGCAPCQPFSSFSNKYGKKPRSNRWRLLKEFIRIIEETGTDIVSMENVPNLSNQKIFKDFVKFLKKKGFQVKYSNVYCPQYGIPQQRRRLVLLASRFGELKLIPPTHQSDSYVTVRDAIGHLPSVESGEVHKKDSLHRTSKLTEINLKRIKASRPGGTWEDWDEDLRLACHKRKSGSSFKSVYGRLSWNKPSSTITTQFYNFGTGRFGHPKQDRALTVREAAILQTFPKKYKFLRSVKDFHIKELGIQIGNAVPVDLGLVIGKSIKEHLANINGKKK